MRSAGLILALLAVFAVPALAQTDSRDRREWNPPARYDVPYTGRLTVVPMAPEQIEGVCKRILTSIGAYYPGSGKRGCAIYNADRSECTIYHIDRPLGLATPKAVLRHETGHCNGWPADHPN